MQVEVKLPHGQPKTILTGSSLKQDKKIYFSVSLEDEGVEIWLQHQYVPSAQMP